MPTRNTSLLRLLFPTCHRLLLKRNLSSFLPALSGDVLIIGTGHDDYEGLIPNASSLLHSDFQPQRPNVIYADAHTLPFPDNSFDSIICIEVFEHLHSPYIASSEIYRVLRHSGSAIISVPFLFRIHGDPQDFHRFTSFGLEKLFHPFLCSILPYGNRFHVIFDLLTTTSKIFSAFRLLNFFFVGLTGSLISHDSPSGYIVRLQKK